ncbi:MAG: arylsulfatase [Verrucomicrobiota bacterium]
MPLPRLLTAYLFYASLIFSATTQAQAQDKRPNIILILADDLGYSDLGCYGGEIHTPNIDRLAAGGLRLTQLYNTARCCPTRASLLTGLYPHQAGLGFMTADNGKPGYRGFLTDRSVTLPSLLKQAGYQTYMSGKWHLRGAGDPDCTPINRGFDEFYGHYKAFASFWRPDLYIRLPQDRPQPNYTADNFYATDAITDYALKFIDQSRESKKPYFLYLAYNAPHFPLHAPKKMIDKYIDVYKKGWDELREERYQRMLKLGVLKPSFQLSPRGHVPKVPNRNRNSPYYDQQIPAWKDLDAKRQHDLARRMATYAAMVEILDDNVGRVMTNLKQHGELENTLLVFLSDNGACSEWDPYGFDNNPYPTNRLYSGADLDTMGQAGTFHSYGTGWANTSNTPFRLYKHYNHEGGISAPMIIHWPSTMKRQGQLDRQPAHVIDLSATLLEVGQAKYPKTWQGKSITPLAGTSLMPLIKGETLKKRPIYFEHEGNRALRLGKWKIVWTNFTKKWELYDIESDRSEMNNLAAKYPDKVKQMDQVWNDWAERSFVEKEKVEQPAKGMPKIYYLEDASSNRQPK